MKPQIPSNSEARSHYYIGKNRYYIWRQKDQETGKDYYFRETKVNNSDKKTIAYILLAVTLCCISVMSSYEPLAMLTFLLSLILLIATFFIKRTKIVETTKEEFENATVSYTKALKAVMNQQGIGT